MSEKNQYYWRNVEAHTTLVPRHKVNKITHTATCYCSCDLKIIIEILKSIGWNLMTLIHKSGYSLYMYVYVNKCILLTL